ncbi:MAG TPA: HD domain-containing phosphohydrolase [Nocardioides sp.]|nr:HD domain-containing phosphohydrolase [Nocardioides sp.]
MTNEGSPLPGGAPRRVAYTTNLYVGGVAAVGLCLTAAAIRIDGITVDATLGVVLLLAVLSMLLGSVESEGGRTLVSLSAIVMLAAMALVGPAGAGIVGMLVGPFDAGRAPLRARIFNSGMFAIMGVVGGCAYVVAGGRPGETPWPRGTSQIAFEIGIPLLVADVVQFAVNLVLLALVVRLAVGVSMRTQVGQIATSSGPAQIGYGIIAFIMVVLWGPARLGSASVFLILPPLLAAQWAYRQYAEERKGHDRALEVLVAAVEAKAPHLIGHSTRVAELSASMAEHLGLRAQAVADARVAGMLHDLGLTTLPTGMVRSTGVLGGRGLRGYPARGVRLLTGLSFLAGALDAIGHHRDAVTPTTGTPAEFSIPTMVVGLADEYDLLTEVGTPDGVLIPKEDALALLRRTPAGRDSLLRALEHALSLRAEVSS